MNEVVVGYIVAFKHVGEQEFSKLYATKGGATVEYNRLIKRKYATDVHHLPVYVKIPS